MSISIFGYYSMGLRALSAAQMGLMVAGDNIANVSTPGYSTRRLDLRSGLAVRVPGGFLDQGVEVETIRRLADRFLQSNLEREKGALAGSEEQLRGLRDIENLFGSLESEGILTFYADFSDRFAELAGQPESLTMRRVAVSSADTLARQLNEVYNRLEVQRRSENDSVVVIAEEVNKLAVSLANLNREICAYEVDGSTAAPLRDQRDVILERLSELTGGSAVQGEKGKVLFSLPAGGTLVTGENPIELETSTDASGMHQISIGNVDITSQFRGGKLGAVLGLRDDQLTFKLADLDNLAADLITRANLLTTGATDLDGNPGEALFGPDPAPATGAAATISVNGNLVNNLRLLAVSATGAPGDGSVAIELSNLRETASAALGNRSPATFLADVVSGIGNEIIQTDVSSSVSQGLVENFELRRDSISGVSLDEEAASLMKHQRAYEAAARFMQVLNEMTEITMTIAS